MKRKFDLICYGRITEDCYLLGKIFMPSCSHGTCQEVLPLGQKLPVEQVISSYGGNAFNASLTFAKSANLKVALIADTPKANSSLATYIKDYKIKLLSRPNNSTILSKSYILLSPTGERTTLRYSNAQGSTNFSSLKKSIKQAKYLYISGTSSLTELESVTNLALHSGVPYIYNPSSSDLNSAKSLQRAILNSFISVLNKEEFQKIFALSSNNPNKLLSQIVVKFTPKCILIITDGPKGAYCYANANYYKLKPNTNGEKVVDRNGAGDAFASAFSAGIIKGHSVADSLHYADLNASSVVKIIGSQPGILKNLIK